MSKSRGIKNLLSRIQSVLGRFGIRTGKFETVLKKFGAVTADVVCVPTFAITAVTLKRHPKVIQELSRQGIEFAVHGNIHVDYAVMPPEEQTRHFKQAVATFRDCQVPFTGFRAPFLRINDETLKVLQSLDFPYDSSRSVYWDTLDSTKYSGLSWREYQRLLDFYKAKKAEEYVVLPRFQDGLVEIPVSIPDDEAMVERLDITRGQEISAIWQNVLQKTYERGELFTLQLHPERILLCATALEDTVKLAGQYSPAVWITTLKEIATWWRERREFTLDVTEAGSGHYKIKANCSGRATVLFKNCRADQPAGKWYDGYQNVSVRDFVLESAARPVIGVAPDTAPAAIDFLKNEGYALEKSERPANYSIYLGGLKQFGEADEKPLAERLEKSGAPLVRYWRWPEGARSALSVTGDIDAMTLIDFALRISENWRQNGRNSKAEHKLN